MQAVATRQRTQPPPPWVVFEDLANPGRASQRPWLHLLDDETPPRVLATQRPTLRWTLLVEPPAPDDRLFRHMCQRIGELINAGLRYTYGHMLVDDNAA